MNDSRPYSKPAYISHYSGLRFNQLADETGGRLLLGESSDELIEQAKEVAKDIGSEYVITYKPTRPLASAAPGEYRKLTVASRRVGLRLRGVVAS